MALTLLLPPGFAESLLFLPRAFEICFEPGLFGLQARWLFLPLAHPFGVAAPLDALLLRLAVELRMQVVAPLLRRLVLFDDDAVGFSPPVLPDARHLPGDLHVRLVRPDHKPVVPNLFRDNGLGELPDDGELIAEVAVEHLEILRQLTDYDRLQVIGANVKEVLSKGKQLRITAPNGTDLTVEIAGQPVFVSDGVVSSEDRYARGPAAQIWLPAGEVYLTPVPKTAEGTFVAETFFYEGKRVDGLTLKFRKGKLTSMTADSDITALQKAYNAAPSERDWFGAIDIGLNPDVKLPSGSRVATWIGSGTISIGIGSNTWAGGDNEVPYGLYGHLFKGTLTVDINKMVDNGRLLVQ